MGAEFESKINRDAVDLGSSSHPTTTITSPLHHPSNPEHQHTMCPSALLRDVGWFSSSNAGYTVGAGTRGDP